MTMVNPALAPREIGYANDRFVAMNHVFEQLLDVQLDRVKADVSIRVERNRAGSIFIALAGIFFAALLVLVSIVLSRHLSRSLEAQIGVLGQFGTRTGAHDGVEDDKEMGRIGRPNDEYKGKEDDMR